MGLSTLSGHTVTQARVSIPAWGPWFADASVDGEVSLAGAVELKIADTTLKGTVLSGGAAKGRSFFRLVGGAGGWGKLLSSTSYADDAGVTPKKIVDDLVSLNGETVDAATVPTTPVGHAFVRREGPGSQVLEILSPRAWYVAADGITRFGRRATSTFSDKATMGQVDLARGTVTLASESIAALVPGVVIEGLEAVDVEHDLSPNGLRTSIWGKRGSGTNRRLEAYRKVFDQLDPMRRFRGVSEYRVATREGNRLNLQVVRVSTGLPDLLRVHVHPGVAGADAEVTLGSRVLVAFVDADPARPVVVGFDHVDATGFAPDSLDLLAGGMVGGEHVMTTEACALFVYNVLVALMAAAGGGPLLAAVLQPLLGTAINTAIAAQAIPAPIGQVAQEAAATAQLAGFGTGVAPATTSAFFNAAIAAVAAKTSNVSGKFPSIGSKSVRSG